MKNIKDMFPLFYATCAGKDDPKWEMNFDFSTESFETVENLFISQSVLLQHDYLLQLGEAEALRQDIIELYNANVEHLGVLRFFKFRIASYVMKFLAGKRMMIDLYNWIVFSLNDDFNCDGVIEVNHRRLIEIKDSEHIYVEDNYVGTYINWTGSFFYYETRTGGHKELAKYFVGNCLGDLKIILEMGYTSDNLIFALAQMQTWAYKNNFEGIGDNCSKALASVALDRTGQDLKDLAMAFCICGAQFTNRTQQDWCEVALGLKLNAHERLQVLNLKFEGKLGAILNNFDLLIQAIDDYHYYLDQNNFGRFELNFEMSRIFSVCISVLNTLVEHGDIDHSTKLIGRFFRIPEEELVDFRLMVIQHNTRYGAQFCSDSGIFRSNTDPFLFSPKILQTMNKFLSLNMQLLDDPDFVLENHRRPMGTPNIEVGYNLEKTLLEHFCLTSEDLKSVLKSVDAYYLYSNFQLPLQPLFIKYFGIGLPIVQTFKKPLSAREIKRVFIWQGDCNMSEFECHAIKSIFTAKGIEVKHLKWHESGKEEFISSYSDPGYDLVWISCHGEFDHYYPQNSKLVLNQNNPPIEEVAVNYADLGAGLDQTSERRLLVLNACDGATTTLANSPASLGFGSSLVNEQQSLISHQWPTDNYSSMILGIILAIGLAAGMDYLVAYQRSIELFLAGKERVLEEISTYVNDPELFERIERAELDYSNIYYYGSFSYLI